MLTSRTKHLELVYNMAEVLDEIAPQSFEEAGRIFPFYADDGAVNQMLFLSSDSELYGIDGTKRWASLPCRGNSSVSILARERTEGKGIAD